MEASIKVSSWVQEVEKYMEGGAEIGPNPRRSGP